MLNKEKYAKEILELAIANKSIGVDKRTMRVTDCNCLECRKDCYVCDRIYPYNQGGCTENFIHWANSEYRELKEFTEQERAVLRALDKIEWVAKDDYGDVYGFTHTPVKLDKCWALSTGGFVNISETTSCKFEAIKSTDTEPTSRAEILGGNEQ